MVYNMLVAFRFYVSFISFLGFVHAKIDNYFVSERIVE